ncbi:cupin domain-containing protein [Methyloferula stellata]|uniref:cupin domain-containing protein n=1 Tax=Methyloferula stellata TaxID=876270 RepID=UPI00035E3736|nr:cupin domain-containing protein [Methyloferula stellata]
MQVRADFSRKEVVRPGEAEWVASPQKGVDRLMLDRIGDEIARATTLVRFEPGSFFPHHVHGGGEEVFVVDGLFEDEHGRYPEGTYLRDPIGTSHSPFTKHGCLLFVKLWQFSPKDVARVVIETKPGDWMRAGRDGMAVLPLHDFEGESTYLIRLAPGLQLERNMHPAGEEILVLDGTFSDEHGDYPAGTWIRDPAGSEHTPYSVSGCTLFVKAGHLPKI